MAKYLVTGAAGFIGNRVAELLLDSGYEVIGLDNFDNGYDVRLKEKRFEKIANREGIEFHRLDISKREVIENLIADSSGIDGVIHLAARAGVRASVEDPWAYVDANILGTLNMLELSKQLAVPKFVIASTSSIYGNGASLPTSEMENSSLPLQPYSATKKGAEALAHSYHYLHGIDVSVVRYFTVFGPWGRPNMVMFRFMKWIMEGKPLKLNGDGTQTRGFTYIDDIARGTILALKPVGYEIFNLGGHQVISINDLIQMMEKEIGIAATIEKYPFHKADMNASHADVSKAGGMLGWKPQVSLQQGVKNMIDWYTENESWAKDIKVD
jgi:UDP-glucuronate 4-epimerase